MRAVPPALQEKLDAGVTTLCRCWRITRRDGVVLGFTDHDEDVVIGGVTCRAGTGLAGSEATQTLGLAVDGAELSGALSDDALTEAELAAGRYDAAEVEVFLVDWSEPALAVLLAKGVVGEVRREGAAFTAELRGLAHRLAEDSGELYTAACRADLGDARCGVDLGDPAFYGAGIVAALDATATFRADGFDGFADGWFTGGRLGFVGGANDGFAVEVKTHRRDGGQAVFELWQATPEPIAPGDGFTVTAGCDKQFGTCFAKFDNVVNFRGFPHIPGNDFVIRYPVQGEPGNDGLSLQD